VTRRDGPLERICFFLGPFQICAILIVRLAVGCDWFIVRRVPFRVGRQFATERCRLGQRFNLIWVKSTLNTRNLGQRAKEQDALHVKGKNQKNAQTLRERQSQK
jgi:hypothetical protein